MSFLKKLANLSGKMPVVNGLSIKKNLFQIIFILSIAVLIILSGCSLGVPAQRLPTNISVTASPIEQSTFKLPLKPPIAGPVRMKPGLVADGLTIDIQCIILNPNLEKLELSDFKVAVMKASSTDYETQDTFPGGEVESASSSTFRFAIEVPFNLLSYRTLNLEIDTQTANTETPLSCKSTTPINISEILDSLIVKPRINFNTSVNKFSQTSPLMVEAQIEGSISNPNPIDLNFTRLDLVLKDKNGALLPRVMQRGEVVGQSIPANSEFPFKSSILLPLTALNQTGFTVNASTSVQFMNNIKSINSSEALMLPDLADLVSSPEIIFTVDSNWDNSVPRKYVVQVKAEIQNPNNFELTASDFQIKLYNTASNKLMKSATTLSDDYVILSGSRKQELFETSFIFSEADIGRKGFEALITGGIKIGMEQVDELIPVSGSINYSIVP